MNNHLLDKCHVNKPPVTFFIFLRGKNHSVQLGKNYDDLIKKIFTLQMNQHIFYVNVQELKIL